MAFKTGKNFSRLLAAVLAAVVLSGCAGRGTGSSSGNDDSSNIFAMGTVFNVRAIGDGAADMVKSAEQTIYRNDELLSWRKEGSLPDIFNKEQSADMSPVKDLLTQTLQVCEDSGGALDITVYPLSRLWKFDQMGEQDFDASKMTVPSDADIKKALDCVGYDRLSFDESSGMLRTEDPSVKIELGAVGKGYAIDQALVSLKESGAKGGLVSAGSSIGLMGTKEDGSPFTVSLRDPRGSETDTLALLETTDCTISTSGDYERYFEKDGRRYCHILDPHSGYPADSHLMQVTIICDSGSLGDALSTACFVLGLDKGMMLAKKYNVLAIFIDSDKNIWYNNADMANMLKINNNASSYTLREYNPETQ